MPTFYDISLPLVNGGLVYPGNPDIRIAPQQEIAGEDGQSLARR